MNKILFGLAFILGAGSVVAMSAAFVGVDILALAITLLIGVVFAIGTVELSRFHKATQSLNGALFSVPDFEGSENVSLSKWLERLHPSLRHAVQLRIEGERVGLPAPVVTPYLIGLLVMLGLLGTFVGMVETLQGAVVALEGSTELAAIREGLAAPINGLGLAFGTSVAGVATSAMLGLMSTLCRRERVEVTRSLDAKIHQELKVFSLNYNRQETYKALQAQAQALPEVALQMREMAKSLTEMGQQIGAQLQQKQDRFHEATGSAYEALAEKVSRSMEDSLTVVKEALAESGKLAGEGLKPVLANGVSELVNSVSSQFENSQARLVDISDKQINSVASMLESTNEQISACWQDAVLTQQASQETLSKDFEQAFSKTQQHFDEQSGVMLERLASLEAQRREKDQEAELARVEALQKMFAALNTDVAQTWVTQADRVLSKLESSQEDLSSSRATIIAENQEQARLFREDIARLLNSSEKLLEERERNESIWIEEFKSRMQALSSQIKDDLIALTAQEQQRSERATQNMEKLEESFATQLAELGAALERPMSELITTASEAPKAAAEVISQLRQEITNNVERDNKLLSERQKIMQELDVLASSLSESSESQREAIARLVGTSTEMLDNISQRFDQHLDAEVDKLSHVAQDLSTNALDISAMGEAFAQAMASYSASNEALTKSLSTIEMALTESGERNNEQLAYYVAQARELIDHSVMSQKAMFDELREISHA